MVSDSPLDPLAIIEKIMERDSLTDVTYPGSKRVRKSLKRVVEDKGQEEEPHPHDWDAKPYKKVVMNGKEVELFTVGALAQAMERSSQTIREWERYGVIPKAPFEVGEGRGKRRLYSRGHIEGLVRIAEEEGILVPPGRRVPDFSETEFTEKSIDLWERMRVA